MGQSWPAINEIRRQVNELEGRRQIQEGLRVAEQQKPTRDQPLVQVVDDAAARAGVEVDEHVPAEDDIDPSKGGSLHAVEQIQMTEVAGLPQPICDVRAVFPLDEVRRAEV